LTKTKLAGQIQGEEEVAALKSTVRKQKPLDSALGKKAQPGKSNREPPNKEKR